MNSITITFKINMETTQVLFTTTDTLMDEIKTSHLWRF